MTDWEEQFHDIDPLNYHAIIQSQLEDGERLLDSTKGKQREGTIRDSDMALQVYMEDLRCCDASLSDRKMAQSIALAVLRDGWLIHQAYQNEQQIARDRELALSLDQNSTAFSTHNKAANADDARQNSEDPWENDEMLAKAAAIYMEEPELPETFHSEPNVAENMVPESSIWAEGRTTQRQATKSRPLTQCIACGEAKVFYDVARTPCQHEYCRSCIAGLFKASMTDESLFPPRCCKQPIPLQQVAFFLGSELRKEFEVKAVELRATNRTYCHDTRCSVFIPRGEPDDEWVICPRCSKSTCVTCKTAAHTGDCPEDKNLQQLIAVAETEQWQRCYKCNRFVELDTRCNHMSCPCGAQFCYVCGLKWKTCSCDQWDENLLLARATQLVDRNPRRQLFQPDRAPRPQPLKPAVPIEIQKATSGDTNVTVGEAEQY
ncbi:putative e3 ubiquitin-protein ligase ari4 [Acrodontium crateriforme]|uniref:E3 ubiquitin-protein ligase ari4 n=1 Tax=Acrodontium crateriforme TaxID=150365 RepID=A0AAQ3M8B3_9PEZI|nr:putative e3 ubiquitin-protein ligase ari4 [Acrodontium crateriforme]